MHSFFFEIFENLKFLGLLRLLNNYTLGFSIFLLILEVFVFFFKLIELFLLFGSWSLWAYELLRSFVCWCSVGSSMILIIFRNYKESWIFWTLGLMWSWKFSLLGSFGLLDFLYFELFNSLGYLALGTHRLIGNWALRALEIGLTNIFHYFGKSNCQHDTWRFLLRFFHHSGSSLKFQLVN